MFRTLGAEFCVRESLLVSRAQGVFDAHGTLSDEKVREQLRAFMEGFVNFARSARRNQRVVDGVAPKDQSSRREGV